MNVSSLLERANDLVQWLEQHRDDRGLMSELRRGFSPATEHYAWPHLARWCNLDDDRQRTIFATVAACYALYPESTKAGNLGTVLRTIAHHEQAGEDALRSFEGRFRRLITCSSAEDLLGHVRSVVQAARQRGIPINYAQLLEDLLRWDFADRRIKTAWAQAYWVGDARGRQPDGDLVVSSSEETTMEDES